MLRLSDVVIDELGLTFKNLEFEKGSTYALNSVDKEINDVLSDILRGYYIPSSGGVYLTLSGNTNNLVNVDDRYINIYNKSCIYINNGVYLLENLSIKDNILLLNRAKRGLNKANIVRILKMVHIDNANLLVKDLSIVDKYRVKIAQILYMQPQLVISNMLFSSLGSTLDIEELEEIESLLCDACKFTNTTLVYIGAVFNESNFDKVLLKSNIVEVI